MKIDSGVPIPQITKRWKKTKTLKYNYPIKDMNPGDSILVPITDLPVRCQKGEDNPTHYTHNIVRSHQKRYKLTKFGFVHRTVVNTHTGYAIGVRIHRVY